VTFEDATSGHAASSPLNPGGEYHFELPAGTYAVSITPPKETVSAGPDSPPSEEFRKVDNIPEKYRSLRTSGLTATVSSGNVKFDFDMQ
jgi:hypothetical protein